MASKIVLERGGVKLTPYEIFKEVQNTIKVGKTKYNSFAKFYFRSVEDIYIAWNTLDVPLVLKLSDEIIEKTGRLFVEAHAEVKDLTGAVVEFAFAQAELGSGKAGMSTEQATGSASSYARKYALNGLFLLDDNKDPDEDEKSKSKAKPESTVAVPGVKEKIKELQDLIRGDAAKSAKATSLLAGRSILKLTVEQINEIISAIK
jgi:hypothetical protein